MLTIDQRFRRVSTGLKLIFASLVLTFASALFWIVGWFIPEDLDNSSVLLVATVIGWLSSVVGIIGTLFCTGVPTKARATGVIYAAFVLSVIGIVLSLASELNEAADEPGLLDYCASFCSLAGSLLFLVFLGSLASFLGDTRSLEKARFLFFGTVATSAVAFALWIMGTRRVPLVGIGAGIFSLYLFFASVNLVNAVRRDVDRSLVRDDLE